MTVIARILLLACLSLLVVPSLADERPNIVLCGLIKGEWKAVRIFPPTGSGEWELFNLKTDPSETANLAVDFPGVMAELIADWDAYADANGVAVFEKDLGYGRY